LELIFYGSTSFFEIIICSANIHLHLNFLIAQPATLIVQIRAVWKMYFFCLNFRMNSILIMEFKFSFIFAAMTNFVD